MFNIQRSSTIDYTIYLFRILCRFFFHNARKTAFEGLQVIYIDKICCFDNSIELYTQGVFLKRTALNAGTRRAKQPLLQAH